MKMDTKTTTIEHTTTYTILLLYMKMKIIINIRVIDKVNTNPRRIVKSDLVKKANIVSATKIPKVRIEAISNSLGST